jgi:hypothetical protein
MSDPESHNKNVLAKLTSVPPARSSKRKRPLNSYPWWRSRFWHGMRFGDWMSLWAQGRFRVHPARAYFALSITLYTPINSFFSRLQSQQFGDQISRTSIDQPPLFIIGHWRSGMTLLHELMELDEQFCSPTTYQCFAPTHFMTSAPWLKSIFARLLPELRPMDEIEWINPC